MPTTKEALDAAAAQVAEAEAPEYVTVPLTGHDGTSKNVRVLPTSKWRASAMRTLNAGDMDGFMTIVLHEDDYDTYVDVDPDAGGIGEFAHAVAAASKDSLGKSSGPSRSGRTTRRP